ncbi:MAG: hypothetical protein IJL07_10725 [Lachnospiraceae bacterium]|nr:hypothetical protein [Lachnospiraceae bacterium]
MESKILSSDTWKAPGAKALIINNIKKTWPIWAAELFFLSWLIPVSLTFDIIYGHSYLNLEVPFDIAKFLLVPACVLMAMKVFGYLMKEKSTTFFHSLPFTRTKLFAVNAVSGFLLIIIPLLLVGIASVIIAAVKGHNIIIYGIEWFLVLCCDCIYVYGSTILIAIIFGNKISGYAMTAILFFYVEIIVNIFNSLFSNLHSSVSYMFIFPRGFFQFLSPISLVTNTYVSSAYWTTNETNYYFKNLAFTVTEELIVGALMIVAAFLLYRYRKSERSGELIAFSSFKLVFKWGFALSFGAFLTMFLGETVIGSIEIQSTINIVQTILFVFFVVLSYLIAEMILQKKFNVFYKLRFEILLPFAASIAVALVLLFDVFGITRYIPDKDDIENLNVNINLNYEDPYTEKFGPYYFINLNGEKLSEYEKIDTFLDLHKGIIADDPDSFSQNRTGYNKYVISDKATEDYDAMVHIWYNLKDDTNITRMYYVPYGYVEKYLDKMETYNDVPVTTGLLQ